MEEITCAIEVYMNAQVLGISFPKAPHIYNRERTNQQSNYAVCSSIQLFVFILWASIDELKSLIASTLAHTRGLRCS